jgi:hypothetical protein
MSIIQNDVNTEAKKLWNWNCRRKN